MTPEEKARAYDEAKARMSRAWNDNRCTIGFMNEIFPELKESEDERIRKSIIAILNNYVDNSNTFKPKMLAWLEKQADKDKLIKELGKYKAKYTQEVLQNHLNSMTNKDDERLRKTTIAFLKEFADKGYENAVECIDWLEKQGQQKPIVDGILTATNYDKLFQNCNVPKFKVGDFIVNDYCFGKVIEITNDAYLLDTGQGIPFSYEHNAHLWTIDNAKPGDVLVSKYSSPFIYNGNYNSDFLGAYCGITTSGDFRVGTEKCQWSSNKNVHPATKEQCDLLFAKMREAGWEWDKDKKELKKIVQKPISNIEPKFHEGDWVVYNNDICQIVKREEGCNKLVTVFGIEKELVNERNLSTARLWTIADAKDGDVLATQGSVFIFKHLDKTGRSLCKSYCEVIDNSGLGLGFEFSINGVCPATKEQRDTLEKAMAEAGYTFDFDKKELRKIEPNLSNSAKIEKDDTLLDLLQKIPSFITIDGIDYHFVLKKTVVYMVFYEGNEKEDHGKVIFWMAGDPVSLLTKMLKKLKKEGLLE